MILRVQGIEVSGKNKRKIDLKMESRWEGILASIFNGFWWTFGGKLGRKIKPRQDKTGQDKTRQRQRQDKTRLWQTKRGIGPFAPGVGGSPRY